jgi:hypothetical protein
MERFGNIEDYAWSCEYVNIYENYMSGKLVAMYKEYYFSKKSRRRAIYKIKNEKVNRIQGVLY